MVNGMGQPAGRATFMPEPGGGVRIELDYMGIAPGTHALHIHTTGVCEGPDFTSAGGHFNPTGRQHGTENPMGAHAGDLPNFEVDSSGGGHASVVASSVTLAEGENSLFHPGGTALMIHAMPDDNRTDPTGNAGARVACGIVQR
jgi:Cu-Zn family superoxide dismutase